MCLSLIAAALTFTATATGVEKEAAVEFFFAGKNTDRDYETMFLLDESIDSFCSKLEKAGLPRGKPTDGVKCRLWPVGCSLKFEPALNTYIDGHMPEGLDDSDPIYTGGTRLSNGLCEAETNMPNSVFSSYTLAQSPIVFNGIYGQGLVYNSFTAKQKLKKGERVKFTVSWDEKSMPKSLHLTAKPGNAVELIKQLKAESEKGELDVLLGFDGEMTVAEATAVSTAMTTIDSSRVKLNGVSNLFYRSFMPLVKWRDRKERLVQPFELTIGDPDKLVYIEEDWNVEGTDPKLTPREISFADALKYDKTDSCLIFAESTTKVSRILEAMNKLGDKKINNWYVFTR